MVKSKQKCYNFSVKISELKIIKKAQKQVFKTFLLIVGIGLGILVAAQWRSMPTRVTDPVAPYTGLKDTRDLLLTEQSQLKNEISKNHTDIANYQSSLKSNTSSSAKLVSLNSQKARAGLTKLSGPGVTVTLDDSKNGPASDDSIIHAPDLRDIVNLLWGSGAEAIQINSERIVTNSSIDCIVNTILVNNTHLTTPFVITALGDQKKMITALSFQDNLSDLYHRHFSNGLIFEFSGSPELTVDAFSGSFNQKSGGN